MANGMANGNGTLKWIKVAGAGLVALATCIGSGLSGAYVMGTRTEADRAAIRRNSECRIDHEARLRTLENIRIENRATLAEIKSDLSWVRKALEK